MLLDNVLKMYLKICIDAHPKNNIVQPLSEWQWREINKWTCPAKTKESKKPSVCMELKMIKGMRNKRNVIWTFKWRFSSRVEQKYTFVWSFC